MKNLTDKHEEILKKWAGFAIYAQDACNLCAVVQTFAQVTLDLMNIARDIGEGTDWVNKHPITVLFVSKLESMCRSDDSMVLLKSFDYVKKLAGKE